MRDVLLYGELGRRFGRRHRFDVQTPAEAVRALAVNFQEFEGVLLGYRPGFHVLVGEVDVGAHEDGVMYPFDKDAPIRIVPAIAGGKSEWVTILIGAALMIAAPYLAPFIGATLATAAGSMGLALVLSGTAQLLTPVPKPSANAQNGEKLNSYTFNGPVNVGTQGGPVPVLYGRMVVGSVVASMGISVREMPT